MRQTIAFFWIARLSEASITLENRCEATRLGNMKCRVYPDPLRPLTFLLKTVFEVSLPFSNTISCPRPFPNSTIFAERPNQVFSQGPEKVTVMKWLPARPCPLLAAKCHAAPNTADSRLADPARIKNELPRAAGLAGGGFFNKPTPKSSSPKPESRPPRRLQRHHARLGSLNGICLKERRAVLRRRPSFRGVHRTLRDRRLDLDLSL